MNAQPDIAPAAEVFTVRAFVAGTPPEYRDGDLPLVVHSWLMSAWGALGDKQPTSSPSARAKMSSGRLYRHNQERDAWFVRRARWLSENRPRVTQLVESLPVLIACPRDDANHIGGWLAIGPEGTVVYAYTKQAYRGFGLIRMLADAAGVEWKR